MYITISPQKTASGYSKSVSDYVHYLEKENALYSQDHQEFFFNQNSDSVPLEEVINRIDANTTKLSRNEPRFYAITVSPSQSELRALGNTSKDLKDYTRQLMEQYAQCFNREIEGLAVQPKDIHYYAKVEHKRYYSGLDPRVRINQPVAEQILALKHKMRRIERGETAGDLSKLQAQITGLENSAEEKVAGVRIREGMEKPGPQSHIHIIVSRKDASNSVSLSPGSKYKASEVEFGGKVIKRGFDRDRFFELSEKVFDKRFGYNRTFAEKYSARKQLGRDPLGFFKALYGLPVNERSAALKALALSGAKLPSLPGNANSITLRAAKKLKRSIEQAVGSASIQI